MESFQWMNAAADTSGKKLGVTPADKLQGQALLAVAEAIHRLAAAVEGLDRR